MTHLLLYDDDDAQSKLFVVTEAGKVYSSNNEGASFTLINPNLRALEATSTRFASVPFDYESGHAKSEYIILQGCLAEVDTNG